jgi:hypothetical protein
MGEDDGLEKTLRAFCLYTDFFNAGAFASAKRRGALSAAAREVFRYRVFELS